MRARIVWAALALLAVLAVGYRGVMIARARRAAGAQDGASLPAVRTAAVERKTLIERLAFTGSVRPRNEVDIYAKLPGRIESVHIEVGSSVRAGDLLAVVEHNEVAWQTKAAQAAVEAAKAGYAGAKLEFDKTSTLFHSGVAAQAAVDGVGIKLSAAAAQLAQAEAAAGLAAQMLANARITSPIAGVVTRRLVNVGAVVGQQSALATIQDLAALKLEAAIDGAQLGHIQKGSPAVVTVEARPGERFLGRVTVISPSLDALTRRAPIEIEIDNTGGRLLPNMFARAEVEVGKLEDVLAVPREALAQLKGERVVFRVRNGRVEAVRPRIGIEDGESVSILDGLAEGERVALSSATSLSDGLEVKEATSAPAP